MTSWARPPNAVIPCRPSPCPPAPRRSPGLRASVCSSLRRSWPAAAGAPCIPFFRSVAQRRPSGFDRATCRTDPHRSPGLLPGRFRTPSLRPGLPLARTPVRARRPRRRRRRRPRLESSLPRAAAGLRPAGSGWRRVAVRRVRPAGRGPAASVACGLPPGLSARLVSGRRPRPRRRRPFRRPPVRRSPVGRFRRDSLPRVRGHPVSRLPAARGCSGDRRGLLWRVPARPAGTLVPPGRPWPCRLRPSQPGWPHA